MNFFKYSLLLYFINRRINFIYTLYLMLWNFSLYRNISSSKGISSIGIHILHGTLTLSFTEVGFSTNKVVDGQNIWATDLDASLIVSEIHEILVGKGIYECSSLLLALIFNASFKFCCYIWNIIVGLIVDKIVLYFLLPHAHGHQFGKWNKDLKGIQSFVSSCYNTFY